MSDELAVINILKIAIFLQGDKNGKDTVAANECYQEAILALKDGHKTGYIAILGVTMKSALTKWTREFWIKHRKSSSQQVNA